MDGTQGRKEVPGIGEMVQPLTALTTLPEDRSSVPRTYSGWLITICNSTLRRGIRCPLLGCVDINMHVAHTRETDRQIENPDLTP